MLTRDAVIHPRFRPWNMARESAFSHASVFTGAAHFG
jgi:hypothetical protein